MVKEKRVTGRAHAKGVNACRARPWYNRGVTQYPLVVRNRAPMFVRGFMLTFLMGVSLMTYVALRDRPPEPHKWWPLIMAAFWACGAFGLYFSLNQEVAVLRIDGPRSIQVERGKAFRRESLWTDHARFWIVESTDSDGDPYFKLTMDAPGGALVVREGHHKPALEDLLKKVEAALKR
ncbi:MAG TPA: hypothetical protein VGE68_05460 [Sphingomicrobium sp.]